MNMLLLYKEVQRRIMNIKKLTKKFMEIVAPYKWWYLLSTLLSVVLIILDLAFAQNSRELFDLAPNITNNKAGQIILIFIVITVLQYLSNFFNGWIDSYINESIVYKMRKDILGKVERLPITFFDNNHSSKVMSIFYDQLEATKNFIVYDLRNLLKLPLAFFLIGGYLFTVHPVLGVTAFLSSALQLVSNITFKKSLSKAIENQRQVTENVFFIMGETMQGIREVKINQLEDSVDAQMEECREKGIKYNLQMIKYYMLRNTIKELPMKVGFIIGIGVGIFLMINGDITSGGLMAFITLLWKMSEPFNGIVAIVTNLQNIMVKAKGLFAVMEEPEEDLHKGISLSEGAPQMEFNNVSFTYSNENNDVLRGVSFKIQSGSTVALVGPSGSGKSTLVRLLYRFYNPQSGEITINGNSLDKYSISNLRKSMSIVSQDVFIFDGTIRENLMLINKSITEEDLIHALEYSQALDFVSKLPQGLETKVGERGVKLSHGQKQRISIARAILKKSNIIILDEPTSALDIDTEISFQQSLGQWSTNCTKIIIAHRLSTIRDADYIIFLDEGQIFEQGKPKELMAQGGRFKEYCMKSNIQV